MKSESLWRALAILLVLSTTPFLASCGTIDRRLKEAARKQADAELVPQAIDALKVESRQPADCRKRERSGVRKGDHLDVALLKTDRALGRANDRVRRCVDWNDAARGAGRKNDEG